MAVAKCAKCEATITVTYVDGSLVVSHGESFLTGCKQRSNESSVDAPADCAAMRTAIAKTGRRAKIERPSPPAAPLPVASPS
jgi:hypothetical protein